MASEEEIQQILFRLLEAIKHLMCCPNDEELDGIRSCLQRKIESLRDQRERLLLKQARRESSLRYQWSWWAYPKNRSFLPCLVSGSSTVYNYQIDAVTAACRDPCLKRSRDVFYVCQLRTSSPEADVAGPLSLYDCKAPWRGDGQLPTVGMQVHPVSAEESSTVQDAIYAAREKFEVRTGDEASGIQFILFETRGF